MAHIPLCQRLYAKRHRGDLQIKCASSEKESAHRCILAEVSPVLEAMLYGQMKESYEQEIYLDIIPDGATLLAFLEYCYLDQITSYLEGLPKIFDALQIPITYQIGPPTPDWSYEWWLLYAQSNTIHQDTLKDVIRKRDARLFPIILEYINLIPSEQLLDLDFLSKDERLEIYQEYHRRKKRKFQIEIPDNQEYVFEEEDLVNPLSVAAIGMYCAVKNTRFGGSQWLLSKIVGIRADEVKVQYFGFGDAWDEWITFPSDRIYFIPWNIEVVPSSEI